MEKKIFFNNIFIVGKKSIRNKKNLLNAINNKNLQGQFSFFLKDKESIYMGRDSIGSKKIFFTLSKGKIFHSKNFLDLTKKETIDFSKIYSVPQNSVIRISKNRTIKKINFTKEAKVKKKFLKKQIDKKLKNFFKILNNQYKHIVILLSGGLDSAIIANYARKYFKKNCFAVTAQYSPNSLLKKKLVSKDLKVSKLICKNLKIKHRAVLFNDTFIKSNLKKILYSCQDWRDYNVHCAVINFACAKFIKSRFKNKKLAVVTGDFMNEFFADYDEVLFKKKIYYKQLRTNNKIRQRFFIKGLDSSARETGVFDYFKIPIFQPFHCVKTLYEQLTLNDLKNKKSKYKFNKKFLDKKIFKLINISKIRAQHDPITGGVISYFFKKKLDQKKITKIFIGTYKTANNF